MKTFIQGLQTLGIITMLTLLFAFPARSIVDLILADGSGWWIIFTTSIAISTLSAYFFYKSFWYQSPVFDKIYYNLSLFWGLVMNLFLASIFYWPILIFTGSPIIAGSTFVIAIGWFIVGVKHAFKLEIKQIDLPITNLAKAWRNKKIGFISDLHIGKNIGKDYVQEIVNKIKEQNIELLLIGGELFDTTLTDWEKAVQPFDELDLRHGIIDVIGNNEYESPYRETLRPILENIGFKLIERNKIMIDGLVIAGINHGISDFNFNFSKALFNLELSEKDTNILLYHEPIPKDVELAMQSNVDVVLSGHTHFGQFAPLNILTWIQFGHFDYGLYYDKKRDSYQYTSSGVGCWGPPVRTINEPEIVIFTLQNK